MMLHSRSNVNSRVRKHLSDSHEERVRRSAVRMGSRLLDKRLEELEKDRKRMDRMYQQQKLELLFELAERKKDVTHTVPAPGKKKLVKPMVKFSDGALPSLAEAGEQTPKRLSLPLELECEAVDNGTGKLNR